MKNFTLKQKLLLLVAFFTLGFVALGLFSLATIDQIKVNGPVYKGIIQQKDLLADILPPPEYLIESYLITLQMISGNKADLAARIEKSKALAKDFDDRQAYWKTELDDGEIKTLIVEKTYKPGKEFLTLQLEQLIPALQNGDSKTVAALQPQLDQRYAEHRAAIDELVKKATDNAVAQEKSATVLVNSKNVQAIGLIGGFLLLAIIVSQWITRDVLRELGGEPAYAASIARRIANGDMTLTIQTHPGDQTSLLVAMRQMQEALRDTIRHIQKAADNVASDSESMSAAMKNVAEGSSRQSEAAGSMATAVEQMTKSITHVAKSADDATNKSVEAGALSNEGDSVVKSAITEINKIADVFSESTQLILTLGEQSTQISAIVNVIKEIADQTNLLALNAAIEAARAGEQGRGFAVVADEVRKLAERTTSSAQEIVNTIDAIQSGTKSAVNSMALGGKQVTEGVRMAGNAGEAMVNIAASSRDVRDSVTEISSALREQNSASGNVWENVNEIAARAGINGLACREVSQAADNLVTLAETLKASTQRFKMPA